MRVDRDYEQLLTAMLTNDGLSQSQMERVLHHLGLPPSVFTGAHRRAPGRNTPEDGWMEVYRTSQLPATLFGVLIDAYQTGMRVMDGKVRDVSIYSIPIHRAGHRP